MGEMERQILDSRKEGHEAIIAIASELGRIGYLISGICFKNGALEVTCVPPEKKAAEWVNLAS